MSHQGSATSHQGETLRLASGALMADGWSLMAEPCFFVPEILMNQSQLRQVLGELNGERTLEFALTGMMGPSATLKVASAMLIPEETDKLVKVTDGKSVYIVEAERIAWIRIGL